MSMQTRLKRLAKGLRRVPPDQCTGGTTLIVGPGDRVPDNAARCPMCGEPHVLVIEEVIVSSREEWLEVMKREADGRTAAQEE